MKSKVAVITGASSGIGAASARSLAQAGYQVILGARRLDRIQSLADELGGRAIALDITDQDSVDNFVGSLAGPVHVLVNNAGGAKGLAPIAQADLEQWRYMWELNVLGTLRVTKALLPKILDSGDGLIITVTSTAALATYDNGAGYSSSKFAQGVISRTLRSELLGQPVRVTELCPGAVETEFSINRFDGDVDRAAKVYEGWQPLSADEVGGVIAYIASLPSHINIDQLVLKPRDQVSFDRIHKSCQS